MVEEADLAAEINKRQRLRGREINYFLGAAIQLVSFAGLWHKGDKEGNIARSHMGVNTLRHLVEGGVKVNPLFLRGKKERGFEVYEYEKDPNQEIYTYESFQPDPKDKKKVFKILVDSADIEPDGSMQLTGKVLDLVKGKVRERDGAMTVSPEEITFTVDGEKVIDSPVSPPEK